MAAKKKSVEKVEDRVTLHRSREGSHEVTVSRVVETTECAKMLAVSQDSQKLGEFFEWLKEDAGFTVCEYDAHHERYYPASIRTEELLADYFDIDLKKVEEERRGLLAALQESHR